MANIAGNTGNISGSGGSDDEIVDTGVGVGAQSTPPPSTVGLDLDDPFYANELSRTTAGGDDDKPPTPTPTPTVPKPRVASVAKMPAPGTPTPPVDDEPPIADPVSTLGADVVEALREARLPITPDDTRESALQRLYVHEKGKSGKFYSDFRATRDEARRAAQETAQLRAMLSPVLQSFRDNQVAQQREAFVATIPDREVDPDGWQRWATEQLLQRDLQREQRDMQVAQEAQRVAAEEQQLSAVLDVDEQAHDAVAQAINTDPEALEAYRYSNQLTYLNLQSRYPDATHDQLVQGVDLMNQLEMRGAWNAGIHPVNLFKAVYGNARALLGTAGNGSNGNHNSNGSNNSNGHAQQQPVVQPQPQHQPQQRATSPTAQRMAQQAQQAAARRVVSPPPTGASPPPAGDTVDMSKWDEDQIMDYVLASPANKESWKQWQVKQYGKSGARFGD